MVSKRCASGRVKCTDNKRKGRPAKHPQITDPDYWEARLAAMGLSMDAGLWMKDGHRGEGCPSRLIYGLDELKGIAYDNTGRFPATPDTE